MKFRVQVISPTGLTIVDEQDVEGDDVAEIVTDYLDGEMQQIEMRMQITCTDDDED